MPFYPALRRGDHNRRCDVIQSAVASPLRHCGNKASFLYKFLGKLLLLLLALLTNHFVLASQLPTIASTTKVPAATTPSLLQQWLLQGPYAALAAQPAQYRLQIRLTEIKRRPNQPIRLTDHSYRVDAEYFYPASSVKLPVAVLALEFLQQHGIDANSPMYSAPAWPGDPSRGVALDNSPATSNAANSNAKAPTLTWPTVPSVADDVRRILLVSDNDSYNRLYELLGPTYINQRLQTLGFTPSQIRHRLERQLTVQQNHQLPAITFTNQQRKILLQRPARQDELTPVRGNTPVGDAYWWQQQLVRQPLDFASRNQWTLTSIHQLTLMLAGAIPNPFELTGQQLQLLNYYRQVTPPVLHERLQISSAATLRNQDTEARAEDISVKDISETDRATVNKVMTEKPTAQNAQQSQITSWLMPALQQPASTMKFLYYGGQLAPDSELVVRNKVGDAYGFYLDSAWFCDLRSGSEFVLTAVIYANSDGVLGDNSYDDQSVAMPYLAWLGQRAVAHFRSKAGAKKPDSAAIKFCQSANSLATIPPP